MDQHMQQPGSIGGRQYRPLLIPRRRWTIRVCVVALRRWSRAAACAGPYSCLPVHVTVPFLHAVDLPTVPLHCRSIIPATSHGVATVKGTVQHPPFERLVQSCSLSRATPCMGSLCRATSSLPRARMPSSSDSICVAVMCTHSGEEYVPIL